MAAIGLAVLVAAAGFGAGLLGARQVMDRPGPLAGAVDVVVPHGGIDEVASALVQRHVIGSVQLFRIAAITSDRQGPLHAAELSFPAHASLRQVLAVLRFAKPVEHLLTIPEGLTAQQIATLFNTADAATGRIRVPREGSVLPQSYAYEFGTPRTTILHRAEAAMKRALDKAWEEREAGLPLATPRDALILASIVERETAVPAERPHVAAVYLNRLRTGMRLQADPTVAYAASGGSGTLDHKLTRADLEHDDPFNTYRNAGLPPAPICSPGLASIEAVLHPASSEDLYFVADGTGGHAFARTLQQHARNVAQWRAHESGRP